MTSTINDLNSKMRILYRDDGLINLYVIHPIFYTSDVNKETCEKNRHLINWIRGKFPSVPNEIRGVPMYFYDINGTWKQDTVCVYGLTKQQYMMLKLSWNFVETILTTEFKLQPGQTYTDVYVPKIYITPSHVCSTRWAKPGYKPSPLKTKS